jgi:probable F420-dependent oxidoreductase
MKLSILSSGTPLLDCAAMAQRAEALGFEAMWVPNHLVAPHQFEPAYPYQATGRPRFSPDTPFADPWIMITHLAGQTRTLQLGVGVFVLPLYNPFAAAKAVATTQELSGNRVLFGVGIGWMKEEFEIVGEPFARRAARTEEMLVVMKKLWTGRPVEHQGEWYRFDTLQMSPGVAAPPILWGGTSAPALERAARLCDGWFGPPSPIEQTLAVREALLRNLAAAGRDPSQFSIWARASETIDAAVIGRYRDAGFKHLALRPPDALTGEPRMAWLDQVAEWAGR